VIDTPWTMCSKIIVDPYHNSSVATRVPSSEPDLGLDITLSIIVCCKQWGAFKYPVSYRVAISIHVNVAP